MDILGISAFYNDSATCISQNGKNIAAAQKEHFTRLYQERVFPTNAVEYCVLPVGRHKRRMELGSKALEARSILEVARNEEMLKKLNLEIKYQNGFRAFAPSFLADSSAGYFKLERALQYIFLVSGIQKKRRKELPENYRALPLMEKLYYLRTDVTSATHIDFSTRIQTVHQETNPKYWNLINEQKGYSLAVNTSFNVRVELIVCTP